MTRAGEQPLHACAQHRQRTLPQLALTGMMVLLTLLFAGAPGSAAKAEAREISLPPDGVQLKPAALPGYEKARRQCVACHSAEYMQYQPSSAARPYWEGVVTRMKKIFSAPLDGADMPDIVDYLVKTYGNEQAQAQHAK